MMKIKPLAVAWLLAALVASSAAAQNTPDAGLAHRRDLARRYFDAVHFDETMRRVVTLIVPAILAQYGNGASELPQAFRDALADAAEGSSNDIEPKLKARAVDLIADKFSAEELEQILKFYESPIGQKIVAKSAEMSSAIGPMMAELMPEMRQDMMRRLCAKIDCSKVAKTPA